MMKSTISPELRDDPKIGRIVKSADEILQKHLGGATHPPEVVWKKAAANGDEATVELDMHFFDVDSATRFTNAELEDTWELKYRVLDIWGDLIVKSYQKTSNRMLDIFREWRKELEEEEEREARNLPKSAENLSPQSIS